MTSLRGSIRAGCFVAAVCWLLSATGCGRTFFAVVTDDAGAPVADAKVVISSPRMLDVLQLRSGWGVTDEHGKTGSMTIERYREESPLYVEVRTKSGMEWSGGFNTDAWPLKPTSVELDPVYYGVQADKQDRGALQVLVWSQGAKDEP